jgi:muramoyltetrapeptide carboxypeptidase
MNNMITYPNLKKGAKIGVTAPSSGVSNELHHLIYEASEKMIKKGYSLSVGKTVWTQEKAKSAPAKVRAKEFNDMIQNDEIGIIIPPWGGELLIEMIAQVDFSNMQNKWILGYSDTSLLLLATTLMTGMATAHGTNLVDLRGEYSDDTTAMWETVLQTKSGESVEQQSSKLYQETWQHDQPSPCVFHLTEETNWKTIGNKEVSLKGRLLGGCIDVIRHLIGTPYGNVAAFKEHVINNDPILWYFENCEMTTTDLRRTLIQMQLAGWFDGCSGIMFGRSDANVAVADYEVIDVYEELATELDIPIVYDIDCGHVPPQLTFINGAFAEVHVSNGKGKVIQHFRP